MFEKKESAGLPKSTENTNDQSVESLQERNESVDEKILKAATSEKDVLFEELEKEGVEMKKTVEQVGMSRKGKIAALFMGMTLFAGSFAQIAEAGSHRSVSDGIKIGASRAAEEVFRGAGRGASQGMQKGLEKVFSNIFGVETSNQRQDRLKVERDYQHEISDVSREKDRATMSVLRDYQNNKITKEKKDELLAEIQKTYDAKISEIETRYGVGQ